MDNFSSNLVFLRKRAGRRQNEQADFLGLKRTTYAGYEAGTSRPHLETLRKISELLGVSTGDLLNQNMDTSVKEGIQAIFKAPKPTVEDNSSLLIETMRKTIALLEHRLETSEAVLQQAREAIQAKEQAGRRLRETEDKLRETQAQLIETQKKLQAAEETILALRKKKAA